MKASFYRKLQEDFVMIRFLQYQDSFDEEKCESTILSIREARKKISMHSPPAEKKVLLYCIDTIFEILNEGDKQKIFDFADAIHNIPEIYMQKRNLYSFRQELKSFQKKYGKQYFPFIDTVKPYFSNKAPENKWEFFSAESDEDFKKLHPVGYKILVIIGIVALMIPIIIYTAYVFFINPPMAVDVSITIMDFIIAMLGFAGAFVVGVGLFNIVAAWIHQYLGHLLTAVCLLGGTALNLFSMYLLYT
ncbi:MAG: hypothetical protein E7633_08720 [Ruminococcaceae bacterium]|nr:hypothetical protein [Oscillospiraceae bacterium]